MKPAITCKELVDFLVDYIDGALPAAQKEEFHRHLAVCAPCVHYVETYKVAIAAGKAAFADPKLYGKPPEPVPEALITAILAARKRSAK
jgi:anti-sigma factor RsiW